MSDNMEKILENTEKISLVSKEAQPNKAKNINSIKNAKNINNMLPPEILERIFQFLVSPRKSLSRYLSNVLLVCRRWRDVGEAPRLWSGHNLTKSNNLDIIQKLLTINRMKAVKKLKIWKVSEEMLQAILESSGISELEFEYVDLPKIKSELIARTIEKMEEITFYNNGLSSQQVKSIFTAICGNSKIKKLNISRNNLSSVEPAQLTKAVIKLEELDLRRTELTSQQTTAIFTAIGDGSKLKTLDLSYNNISSVEPAQLKKAVIKLEELDLRGVKLTSQQANAIFTAIGDGNYKLKKLDLTDNNLSSVEPAQLAKAVLKLEELNLSNTTSWQASRFNTKQLTSQQANAIFTAIGDGNKLKKLDLTGNNLSSVEPAQVAKAFIKLEEVDLRKTELTSQTTAIFTAIRDGNKGLSQNPQSLKQLQILKIISSLRRF